MAFPCSGQGEPFLRYFCSRREGLEDYDFDYFFIFKVERVLKNFRIISIFDEFSAYEMFPH